jgi:hypothetical protein
MYGAWRDRLNSEPIQMVPLLLAYNGARPRLFVAAGQAPAAESGSA